MQLHPDALVPADRLRTNRYQLTNLGRRVAVLFTKTYGRVLAPGLSTLDPYLPAESHGEEQSQYRLALFRESSRRLAGGTGCRMNLIGL
jgi:hypothetical protein